MPGTSSYVEHSSGKWMLCVYVTSKRAGYGVFEKLVFRLLNILSQTHINVCTYMCVYTHTHTSLWTRNLHCKGPMPRSALYLFELGSQIFILHWVPQIMQLTIHIPRYMYVCTRI